MEVHANNLNFVWSKNTSKGAQYVTLDSKIKCLSFYFIFFKATPPIKLKLELHKHVRNTQL